MICIVKYRSKEAELTGEIDREKHHLLSAGLNNTESGALDGRLFLLQSSGHG
jgi:hypothetical protein